MDNILPSNVSISIDDDEFIVIDGGGVVDITIAVDVVDGDEVACND